MAMILIYGYVASLVTMIVGYKVPETGLAEMSQEFLGILAAPFVLQIFLFPFTLGIGAPLVLAFGFLFSRSSIVIGGAHGVGSGEVE